MATQSSRFTKGFSVLELSIGVLVLGLIMMGTMKITTDVSQQARAITSMADEGKMFRGPGQQMISAIENADMSSMFLHLPVTTGACVADSPCIRELNGDALVDSTLSGVDSIEFFRDAEGVLSDKAAWSGSSAIVKYNKPLSSTVLSGAGNKYVTWPLKVDDSSRPFVMLSRHKLGDYFTFKESSWHASSASAISGASRWVFFDSSRPNIKVSDYKNTLMVIYNSNNPEQFILQTVSDIMDCKLLGAGGKSVCEPAACIINAGAICPAPPATATTDLLNGKVYAMKLDDIPLTKLFPFQPNVVAGTGTWFSQVGSQTFPRSEMSFKDTTDPVNHFQAPIDLRVMKHYYTLHPEQKARVIAYPVMLSAYRLVSKIANGKKTVEMLGRTFDGGVERALMMGLDETTRMFFARKVGTLEVSVLAYKDKR